MDILIILCLLALGYFAGSYAERKHYRSIREREEVHLEVPVVTFKTLFDSEGGLRGMCRIGL